MTNYDLPTLNLQPTGDATTADARAASATKKTNHNGSTVSLSEKQVLEMTAGAFDDDEDEQESEQWDCNDEDAILAACEAQSQQASEDTQRKRLKRDHPT